MAIHIGKLIKEKARIRRLSQEMIGKKINTTKQNVGNIFRRKSIDTELLLKLCEALEYNFFEHYYNEEPLKSMRNEEMVRLQETVKRLKDELSQKNESIDALHYMTEVQKENINFWKEEARKYNTGQSARKKK